MRILCMLLFRVFTLNKFYMDLLCLFLVGGSDSFVAWLDNVFSNSLTHYLASAAYAQVNPLFWDFVLPDFVSAFSH